MLAAKYINKVAGISTGVGLVLILLWGYVTVFPPPIPDILPVNDEKTENISDVNKEPIDDTFIEVSVVLDEVITPSNNQISKSSCQNPHSVNSVSPLVMTASATNDVIDKGKELLVISDSNKDAIPDIYGDFSRLHMDRYIEAVFKCNGKLVIYDLSGKYGFEPLVQLDHRLKPVSSPLVGYYKERPRLLRKPYSKGLSKVIKNIKVRDYPMADLQPAIILPRKTEYYILGAIKSILSEGLFEYEYLKGIYILKSGNLIFRVTSGKKKNGKAGPLPKQIEIDFSITS